MTFKNDISVIILNENNRESFCAVFLVCKEIKQKKRAVIITLSCPYPMIPIFMKINAALLMVMIAHSGNTFCFALNSNRSAYFAPRNNTKSGIVFVGSTELKIRSSRSVSYQDIEYTKQKTGAQSVLSFYHQTLIYFLSYKYYFHFLLVFGL